MIPSISSVVGGVTPERYIWRLGIAFFSFPRLFDSLLYYNFLSQNLSDGNFLLRLGNKLLFVLHWIQYFSLFGLTYISSKENYRMPAHVHYSQSSPCCMLCWRVYRCCCLCAMERVIVCVCLCAMVTVLLFMCNGEGDCYCFCAVHDIICCLFSCSCPSKLFHRLCCVFHRTHASLSRHLQGSEKATYIQSE